MTERSPENASKPQVGDTFEHGGKHYLVGENNELSIFVPKQDGIADLLPTYAPPALPVGKIEIKFKYTGPGTVADIQEMSARNAMAQKAIGVIPRSSGSTSFIDQDGSSTTLDTDYLMPHHSAETTELVPFMPKDNEPDHSADVPPAHHNRLTGYRRILNGKTIAVVLALSVVAGGFLSLNTDGSAAEKVCTAGGLAHRDDGNSCEVAQFVNGFNIFNHLGSQEGSKK